MFWLQAGQVVLRRWMVSPAADGGGRPGPRALGLAALGACRAVPFPGGCPGPWDQTARGDHRLAPGEAVDRVAGRAPPAAAPRAKAGQRGPPREGVGVLVPGG